MKKKVCKVCIVGFGVVAEIHAIAVDKCENAELYAVCDIKEDRIAKCKERYDVIGYSDFDDVLNDKNIDAVHICTPHYLHYEMAKKAVEHNKSVVLEKPVVIKREEFKKLSKLDGDIAIVFQNRLNPCMKKLKSVVESKEYGEIVGIKSVLTWYRDAEYYKSDLWRGKWETEGGGVLINQSVHSLDILCWLCGKVKKVNSVMANLSIPQIEVEDTCVAYIEFESGVKGSFFATNSYCENSPMHIEVIFENGRALYHDKKLYLNNKLIETDVYINNKKAYWGSGHLELIDNVYSKNIKISLKDVENTMDTVFSIYENYKKDGA